MDFEFISSKNGEDKEVVQKEPLIVDKKIIRVIYGEDISMGELYPLVAGNPVYQAMVCENCNLSELTFTADDEEIVFRNPNLKSPISLYDMYMSKTPVVLVDISVVDSTYKNYLGHI